LNRKKQSETPASDLPRTASKAQSGPLILLLHSDLSDLSDLVTSNPWPLHSRPLLKSGLTPQNQRSPSSHHLN